MLSPVKKRARTRRIAVYDMEWVPGTLRIRCVGHFDGQKYRWWTSVDGFLDFALGSHRNGTWYYAHAGGLADVQFLLWRLLERPEYHVEASFSGSSAIIVRVSKGKKSWFFLDSFWLFRDSLKNIGASLGEGWQKGGPTDQMSQDEVKDWYANVSIYTLTEYCEQDCRILYEAIRRFESELLDLGSELQKTIASNAMMLFRRRYLSKTILTNEGVNERAQKSYFASRVEVFQHHCDEGWYVDINSSFPYAMTGPVPGQCRGSTRRLSDSALASPDDRPALVKCRLKIPDTYLPPLPTRLSGRLFFPVGVIEGWYTAIDVALAVREGAKIQRVHEVLHFDTNRDLADYATDLYHRRKNEKNPFRRILYKYLLNSLYGKFAESTSKDRMVIHPTQAEMRGLRQKAEDSGVGLREWMLRPGVFLAPHEATVAHRHVPIATYITSRARRTLYDYLARSRTYHYCDTDGFSTEDIYSTSDELGGLKIEKKIKQGRFVAPKIYSLETMAGQQIYKAKGFSLSRSLDPGQDFAALVSGQDIETERMSRVREAYKKGIFRPYETVIKKKLRLAVIPKRFAYPDGITRPWDTKELQE